jgi:hypothetical protein
MVSICEGGDKSRHYVPGVDRSERDRRGGDVAVGLTLKKGESLALSNDFISPIIISHLPNGQLAFEDRKGKLIFSLLPSELKVLQSLKLD